MVEAQTLTTLLTRLIVIGHGLLLFFALCAVSLLVGYGILAPLRLTVPRHIRLFLAPVATFVFWSLALGLTGGLKIPVKYVTFPLWGVSLLLIFAGLRANRPTINRVILHLRMYRQLIARRAPARAARHNQSSWFAAVVDALFTTGVSLRAAFALLATCAILPLPLLARYFWDGLLDYLGSRTSDGWAYVAIGRYVWAYPRGAEGNLAPLYQYGAVFARSRYVSFSLLGFLSPLGRLGDTQSTAGLLQAWTFFTIACATVLFWLAIRQPLWAVFLGTALTLLSGWTANMIWTDNFDNQLALVYLPAIATLINLTGIGRRRWWLLGALVAGAFYTYIELFPVLLVCAVIFVSPWIWARRAHWLEILRGAAIATAMAAVLALPFVTDALAYMREQLAYTDQSAPRAGETYFLGLLVPSLQPEAFWGLGGEQLVRTGESWRRIAGIALTLLASVGMRVLARRRHWGLVGIIVAMTGGALAYLIVQQYPYAAYKIINIEWWALIAALVVGVGWLAAQLDNARKRRVFIALSAIALLSTFVAQIENIQNTESPWHMLVDPTYLDAKDYRQVQDIVRVTQHAPLLMLVNDYFANEWAVYYLRNELTTLGAYRQYMARSFALPTMRRSTGISPNDIRYVLTDTEFDGRPWHWQGVWEGKKYRLWLPGTTDWSVIADIQGSEGAGTVADSRSWSLAGPGATFRVWSARDGSVLLRGYFDDVDASSHTISLTTSEGIRQLVQVPPGQQRIQVPVIRGETMVTLADLGPAATTAVQGASQRPLTMRDIVTVTDDQQSADGTLNAEKEPSHYVLDVSFSRTPASKIEPLLTTGVAGAGDFIYVQYVGNDQAVFGVNHWGYPSPQQGKLVKLDVSRPRRVVIEMDFATNQAIVSLDGVIVVRAKTPLYPTRIDQATIGENRIIAPIPAARFSGTIAVVDIS